MFVDWLFTECHISNKLRSSLNESDLWQQSATHSRLKLILLRCWYIIIVTSGQSNLTTGRITATHGRFSGIRQVQPHVIHASLGPPESKSQMSSQLVQPFLQGSLLWLTHQMTDHAAWSVTIRHVYVRSTAMPSNNTFLFYDRSWLKRQVIALK